MKRVIKKSFVPEMYNSIIDVTIGEQEDIESNKFKAKLYTMSQTVKMNFEILDVLMELTPSARSVLFYVIKKLEYNDLNIILIVKDIASKLNITPECASRAIKELVNKKLLFKTIDYIAPEHKHLCSPKMYSINTNYYYYGSNKVLYDKIHYAKLLEDSEGILVYDKNM